MENDEFKQVFLGQVKLSIRLLFKGLLGFLLFGYLFSLFFMSGRDRVKPCLAKMRVFMGAIEMYNADNEKKIKEYNQASVKLLLDNKLLKSSPICNQQGSYSGNKLNGIGVLKCSKHGTPGNPIYPPLYPWGDSIVVLNLKFLIRLSFVIIGLFLVWKI
ncbi:hypothetical protein ACFL35_07295 [Candidatus Riflebacteria bacterium]